MFVPWYVYNMFDKPYVVWTNSNQVGMCGTLWDIFTSGWITCSWRAAKLIRSLLWVNSLSHVHISFTKNRTWCQKCCETNLGQKRSTWKEKERDKWASEMSEGRQSGEGASRMANTPALHVAFSLQWLNFWFFKATRVDKMDREEDHVNALIYCMGDNADEVLRDWHGKTSDASDVKQMDVSSVDRVFKGRQEKGKPKFSKSICNGAKPHSYQSKNPKRSQCYKCGGMPHPKHECPASDVKGHSCGKKRLLPMCVPCW